MKSLTSLSLGIDSTLIIVGIIAVITIIVILLIIKKGKTDFKRKTAALAEETKPAYGALINLLTPTRLIEDDHIKSFKKQYQTLITKIDNIENHRFFDEKIFNQTCLVDFKQKYTNLIQEAQQNNKIFHALQNIKTTASSLLEKYRKLTEPDHYFAYSEQEEWLSGYKLF